VRRFALAAVVAAFTAIGVGYAGAFLGTPAPAWAAWALALGSAGALGALLLLGAARSTGTPRAAVGAAAAVTSIVAGGFAFALTAPDLGAAEPLLLGLPRRLAVVLYGVGLLPALVLPWAYAAAFDRGTLSEDALARVEAAARARRDAR
jgi:hypothetical protein